MELVYCAMYDTNDELVCITRTPMGASLFLVEQTLEQMFEHLCVPLVPKLLTQPEAETYIEMNLCCFVDLKDCGDALMPIQGWRDENGNRIEERY